MLMQKLKGNDNIQAGRDVIMHVINGINSPLDVDQAITSIQEYIDRLLWKKGLLDFRIPLIIVIILLGAVALKSWSLISIPLACGCIPLSYAGVLLRKKLSQLDAEFKAANLVLIEFYKIKLTRRFSD